MKLYESSSKYTVFDSWHSWEHNYLLYVYGYDCLFLIVCPIFVLPLSSSPICKSLSGSAGILQVPSSALVFCRKLCNLTVGWDRQQMITWGSCSWCFYDGHRCHSRWVFNHLHQYCCIILHLRYTSRFWFQRWEKLVYRFLESNIIHWDGI